MFCRGKSRKYKVEPQTDEKSGRSEQAIEADKADVASTNGAIGSNKAVEKVVVSPVEPIDKWEKVRGDVELHFGAHVMKLLETNKWDSREVGVGRHGRELLEASGTCILARMSGSCWRPASGTVGR